MQREVQTIVEVDGANTYYGEAGLGCGTDKANWKIRRASVSGTTTTTMFPVLEGTSGYPSDAAKFKWDDRKILSYSLSRDVTAATLSTVTIASNNTDPTKAKVGDTVTLTIIATEALSAISATIAGNAATIVSGADDAHYTATYTIVTGDTTGAVPFTIDFTDNAGVAGTQVTAVTGGSGVTFDKTAPTMLSAVKTLVTTITLTLSELALASTITKANDGGFVVFDTVTPATTYAVSAIAPGATNDLVVLTVADMTASAAAGVTVTYAAGGNGTVSDLAANILATNATGVVIAAW